MSVYVKIVLKVTVFLVGLAWVVAVLFQTVLNVMPMQLFAHSVVLDMGHQEAGVGHVLWLIVLDVQPILILAKHVLILSV